MSGRTARATGGLDPDLGTPPPLSGEAPSVSNPMIRVLLATGVDPRSPPAPGASVTFPYGGKTYRGVPSIVDGAGGKPGLVATLDIDAYLYGVVPLEIGRSWPTASLQSQAIVARTFALAHRLKGKAYDLVAGEGDQVWGGIEAETAESNAAVDATEGQFVTYAGGLASVFYSSSCGGHTADAARVWGGVKLPYLRGVADPYCMTSSPYAHWTATTSVGTLVAALGPRVSDLGPLQAIELGDPAPDERRGMRLTGARGSLQLSGAEVRGALGSRTIPSTLWHSLTLEGEPAQAATLLRIEGSGLGHGVGLCQWGARVMAQEGRTAREIVGFYFPGTIVTNV